MDDQERNVCTHCGSRDLLEVAATPSQHSHIVVTARGGGSVMRTVRVCKYVCTDCGRIEEWVHGVDDLAQLKAELLGDSRGAAAEPVGGDADTDDPDDGSGSGGLMN